MGNDFSETESEYPFQEFGDNDEDIELAENLLDAIFVPKSAASAAVNRAISKEMERQKNAPVSLDESTVPETIGRFEVRRLIGRGSFGNVYEAFDPLMLRSVAIKVAREHVGNDPLIRGRFFREIQLAAKLNHPGIVKIYEAGENDGHVFFAMELLSGKTLAQWLASLSKLTSFETAAEIVRQAALSIEHGHERGVVHRDLKPDNLMIEVDTLGNTCIRVLDFGLAFGIEDSMRYTSRSTLMGTPLYMSPEQIDSDMIPIGPRSDVFSLGAILYELLTGSSPFASDSLPKVIDKIRSEEIAPPIKTRASVPKDLDIICMKCLRSNPAQRYQTAADLANDLDSFLNERPIQARNLTAIESVANWFRRSARVPEFGLGLVAVNMLVLGWAVLNYPLVMSLFPGSGTDDVSREMFLPVVCMIIPCHGLMLWSSLKVYWRQLSRPILTWHLVGTLLMAIMSISFICLTSNTESMNLNRFERVAALGLMSTFAEVQGLAVLGLLCFARFPQTNRVTDSK